MKGREGGENFITRSFVIRTLRQVQYNQVERADMGGACNTNGEKRNAYRLLLGMPEGNRSLGRPRIRWVDNIKMDLGEIE
jgi:hypothetical protein